MLLANNVLLVVACASVLLGTLYPLFLDALNLGKISVGPPYFDATFVPLMTPLVFLMGIGPLAQWKRAELPDLVAAAEVGGGRLGGDGAAAAAGRRRVPPGPSFGLLLALWIVTTSVVVVRERVRGVRSGVLAQLARQPRGFWGMIAAHLGVAVFIVGVTLVKSYEVERDVKMNVGDTVSIGG